MFLVILSIEVQKSVCKRTRFANLVASNFFNFKKWMEEMMRSNWNSKTMRRKVGTDRHKKNEAVPPQHYLSPNQIKPNYSFVELLSCPKGKTALCHF